MDEKDLYDFLKGRVQIDMTNTTPKDWVNLIYQFENIRHNLNADAQTFMDKIRNIDAAYDIEVDGQRHKFVRFMNHFKNYMGFQYLTYAPHVKDVWMDKYYSEERKLIPYASLLSEDKDYELELGF